MSKDKRIVDLENKLHARKEEDAAVRREANDLKNALADHKLREQGLRAAFMEVNGGVSYDEWLAAQTIPPAG